MRAPLETARRSPVPKVVSGFNPTLAPREKAFRNSIRGWYFAMPERLDDMIKLKYYLDGPEHLKQLYALCWLEDTPC